MNMRKNLIRYPLLALASILALAPTLWMFFTSIKPRELAYQPDAMSFTPTLGAYVEVFTQSAFMLFFFNSLLVGIITTVVSLLVGVLAAYSFARFNTGGLKTQFGFLSAMIFPPVVIIIPMYFIFFEFGLINTRAAIILGHLTFGIPLAIWFLIGFFEELPRELEEAAMIDGDTRLEAIFFILVPSIKEGVIAAGILVFVLSWNNFIYPLILAGNEATRTLPIAVANFNTFQGLLIFRMAAGIIVIVLPMFLLAFYVQNYLVQGLAKSGVDG
jgi:multiple sugar transport system permease protein